ncbi:hypothetical protein SNEBB_008513 [Seison nebaliae]|nr:hypothetical protein SNEBB_008513 [Seison nebaliae]
MMAAVAIKAAIKTILKEVIKSFAFEGLLHYVDAYIKPYFTSNNMEETYEEEKSKADTSNVNIDGPDTEERLKKLLDGIGNRINELERTIERYERIMEDQQKKEKYQKLNNELNNFNGKGSQVKYGAAKPNTKLPTGLNENDCFLSVQGFLRKVRLIDIRNYAFEKGIEVKQISVIDKFPDGTPMTDKLGKIIIRMNIINFNKAFDETIWPEGTILEKVPKISKQFMSTRCSNCFPLSETLDRQNIFQQTKKQEDDSDIYSDSDCDLMEEPLWYFHRNILSDYKDMLNNPLHGKESKINRPEVRVKPIIKTTKFQLKGDW